MPRKPRWNGVRQEPPPAKRSHIVLPLFFRGYRTGRSDEDIGLLRELSLNDWYGHGVLVGLGLEKPLGNDPHAMHYAGGAACSNQYLHGIQDGRAMKRAGGEAGPDSEDRADQLEDPAEEPTEQ